MLVTGDVVFADGSTSVDIKSHDLSSNGLKLDGTLVTASAAEINKLESKILAIGPRSESELFAIRSQGYLWKNIYGKIRTKI